MSPHFREKLKLGRGGVDWPQDERSLAYSKLAIVASLGWTASLNPRGVTIPAIVRRSNVKVPSRVRILAARRTLLVCTVSARRMLGQRDIWVTRFTTDLRGCQDDDL